VICRFCGIEFEDRPVKQNGQIYCSIGCADLASEMAIDSDNYYDDNDLEYNPDAEFEYGSEDEDFRY